MSSLHNQTDSSISRKKIKSIKGTNRSKTIHLLIDSKFPSSPKVVATSLKLIFNHNSSYANYDHDFSAHSKRFINSVNTVDLLDLHQTILNSKLKIEELEDALQNYKIKTPGPDVIPYSFIKNSPKKSTNHLLAIYNTI